MAIKKTRQRVYKKVRRTPKSLHRRRFDVKKSMRDPTMKSLWDDSKTVTQNLAATSVAAFAEQLPEKIPKSVPKKLSEWDAPIVKKLHEKHGDDYKAMERDIKVNVLQWTAANIEKRVAKWKRNYVSGLPKGPAQKDDGKGQLGGRAAESDVQMAEGEPKEVTRAMRRRENMKLRKMILTRK
ncbi:unnamed protein product [Vitrella brassicaformis CCMP3155]|uniref:Nucleolar protein 16 n=2 Tax=Vitrella brassicaformis TaxID=1169539 RepID=A0A0G4EHD3_VITBC|nr:unnamed protein product [Vitrella brassicaformis CCMP3155]|mmetsp:Transcript_24018/g.59359  ORF Transcript_24018/g.59359 Transcript_24018/m.59359 type:complete len:182 (+) Transcript_24018:29-574(+)|eukprot:CEL95393.1 unnamed protein product [Vitrella brassicaformis CCMP3155]